MKNISFILTLCIMLFTISFVEAQNESKPKNTEFKVSGNCSMCKKTIESSLKGKSGITSSVWNKDSKIIKVTYDPSKISEEQIQHKIAESGYDTENKKASDKAYNALTECCQYRR